MARSATHDGECQLCGRVQRLPGGELSKHGYTVQWSAFQGTCPGSGHLPYEQSADLIAETAKRVRAQAANLRKAADERAAQTASVLVHERFSETGRGGRRQMISVQRDLPVAELTLAPLTLRWTDKLGKPQEHALSWGQTWTIESAVAHLNGKHAEKLRTEAEQCDRYAAWLDDRAANWVLRELRPAEHKVVNQCPKAAPGVLHDYRVLPTARFWARCTICQRTKRVR